MSDDTVVRRATEADAARMSRFASALNGENLNTIRHREPPTESEQREFVAKAGSNGRAFFLVAVGENKVLGMLDLWTGEKPYDRHIGRLGVSVLEPWRGRGIGRRLMEAAIHEVEAWPGFCRIELEMRHAQYARHPSL